MFQIGTLAAEFELLLIGAILPNNQYLPTVSIIASIFGFSYGILLFYNLAIYQVFFDLLRNVPDPRYGYLLALKVLYNHLTKKKIAAQVYADLARETPNDGILALRSFGSTTILVIDPAAVSTVLVSQRFNYTKPPTLRKFLRPLLGDGLVFLEGEEHRFWRNNTQPAFSLRRIHEVLRLYQMLPMQSRVAGVDTFLLGNLISKGTRILMSAWIMNRSQKLWGADASELRPSRWIDADGKPNNTGQGRVGSMTFGRGPEACIGESFTKAELRCLISAMISRYKWRLEVPDEDMIPVGMVTIRPANGLRLKLKRI